MKLFCNDEESEEVCKIMNEFDVHNSTYIKVNHIEFSKQMTSKRAYVGAPMLQVESNCVKVNGTDIFFMEILIEIVVFCQLIQIWVINLYLLIIVQMVITFYLLIFGEN